MNISWWVMWPRGVVQETTNQIGFKYGICLHHSIPPSFWSHSMLHCIITISCPLIWPQEWITLLCCFCFKYLYLVNLLATIFCMLWHGYLSVIHSVHLGNKHSTKESLDETHWQWWTFYIVICSLLVNFINHTWRTESWSSYDSLYFGYEKYISKTEMLQYLACEKMSSQKDIGTQFSLMFWQMSNVIWFCGSL